MNEKSWSISCAGAHHKKENIPCEDYSSSGKKNGMKFIVIADGAGSLENSKEGAEIAGKAIVDYVSRNFERLYSEDVARAKFFIMNHILFSIKQKRRDREIKSFGSTLVFLGVKKGQLIMFHLGDGAILAENRDKYNIISKPMNGESKSHTWLTTTKDAHKFARFDRGISTSNFYVAVSDGCYHIFENMDEGMLLWNNILNEDTGEKIKKYIEADCIDDFSFSVMSA